MQNCLTLSKYEDLVAGDGISFLLHITPKIPAKQLKSALTKLIEENPVLRAKIEGPTLRVTDELTPDVEHIPLKTLQSVKYDVPSNLTQKLLTLSSTNKYRIRDNKTLRVLAVDLDDTTLLDFHINHQISDGVCLIENLDRFMELLDESAPVNPREVKSITSEWIQAGNLRHSNSVKPINFSEWGKFSTLTLPTERLSDFSEMIYHHNSAELTTLQTNRLIKRSKENKTTMMGALWSASMIASLAMQDHYGGVTLPTNVLLRTPVNMRGLYPEYRVGNGDITFGSFPVYVPLKIESDTKLWDAARNSRDQLLNEIQRKEQERQFFCHHSMGEVCHPEPKATVNATSIGLFKFKGKYPSGHSVIDAKLMVTYLPVKGNAVVHVDTFAIGELGTQLNFTYPYPVMSDQEAIVMKRALEETVKLMADLDDVTAGDVVHHLQFKKHRN